MSSRRLPIAAGAATTADLPARILVQATEFGRTLARLPVGEASTMLGQLYSQALPFGHRSLHGIFSTPPALVRRLLDQAEQAGHDWKHKRALDPSCGAGAFLAEAAIRMLSAVSEADPSTVLTNLATRLRGWDIDPFATWLAQVAIEATALNEVIAAGRRLAPVAEVRNPLNGFDDAIGQWDLVMGNPPFGKVKDTPPIRKLFRRSLHGHPNLYGLFVDLAIHLAQPTGGLVAHVTPGSFLAGEYFRNLRRLMHTRAPPVSLDLVQSRKGVFDDVLQEVALFVLERGRPPRSARCAAVHVAAESIAVDTVGSLLLPDDPDAPWLIPRSARDEKLVECLLAMPMRLADRGYKVSTGPLVWNRHKAQLHDTFRAGRVPVVWAESVTQDGQFVLKANKRNHRPWFEPRGRDDPNLVSHPCVLVQRTTAKEQHRRLISAMMPESLLRAHGAVAVENHLNMIKPISKAPKVPMHALAAFLATEAADRVLRCINASVAVSASELAAMPLPPANVVVAAMSLRGPEAAIRALYGLAET